MLSKVWPVLSSNAASALQWRQSLPTQHTGRRAGYSIVWGQRQRISIARAFLKNAPVLILAEATSHVDAVSEARVRTALDELMNDRTTVIIARRLSTIRAAGEILVMRDGPIVEWGTHRETDGHERLLR
ncbi:ATP-binding cassette domain-containing protein (plasmid) [Shinella oryzae]|uniref:ATP-binding cassette domain-containing protein n=1 Tax=Shinella oryzae TaxID=2871820 RepID=A0ABY9KBD2_9HYPH|nr:ATP-binding cassette domain-containing protein [Shinella oryzae]WLS04994.1 ATP-binding cassette domain-containing protein [Shinella oryzae]